MARRDVLLHGVGDTPIWPGSTTPQDDTVTLLTPVMGKASFGSPSISTPPPYPNKNSAGLYVRADQSVDVARYNNNAPADHIFFTLAWSAINGTVNGASGNFNWGPIDNALSALPNAKFTLRIQAGNSTPAWVKTASGGSLLLTNQSRGVTADCPRWWTTAARDAWIRMINAAGARYNSNPRIAMISADLVMVVYSEPYILGGHVQSAIDLYNAGLTSASVQTTAIFNNVADTVAAFPNTLVELCMHDTLQYPKSNGIVYSWPVARQLAYDVALTFGEHICFTDYGLGPPDTLAAHPSSGGQPLTELDSYQWMKKRREGAGAWAPLAGPIGFQYTMRGQTTGPDHVTAADNVIALKGQFAETLSHASMTQAERTNKDAAMKANAY